MCQKYRPQKSPVKKNINSKSQDVRKCGCVGGWGRSLGAVHDMQRLSHQLLLPCYIHVFNNLGWYLYMKDVVNSIPVASGDSIDIK